MKTRYFIPNMTITSPGYYWKSSKDGDFYVSATKGTGKYPIPVGNRNWDAYILSEAVKEIYEEELALMI